MAEMRIQLVFEAMVLSGTLNDSPAARSFADLLPLSLELSDYAGTEKIADLPSRLDIDQAPGGCSAQTGDITYYAPWGNLALFYKDFGFSKGLVNIGTLDDSGAGLNFSGSQNVVIRLAR